MYNNHNRRRRHDHHHRDGQRDGYRNHEHENFDTTPEKKYSKGMILLKSSVFAMFIVLVTLSAAFLIIKNKKQDGSISVNISECKKTKTIKTSSAIERVESDGGVLLITTKVSDGKQEIIRVDSKCGTELNRIVVAQ